MRQSNPGCNLGISCSVAVYMAMFNSGIGGSLGSMLWMDLMSDWAVAASKEQESFMTVREGMKMARRNAGSDKEESENIPEVICRRVMP